MLYDNGIYAVHSFFSISHSQHLQIYNQDITTSDAVNQKYVTLY